MSAAGATVRVRLVGIPLELHRRSGEHREALRRELAFVEHAQAADAAPARLRALTKELTERYGGATQAQAAQVEAALGAGDPSLDLEFDLPTDVVEDTRRIGALLDELDELCREGDLLTLVTPPELVAYRRWVLGEFERQVLDGRPPTPWAGPATGAAEPETTPGSAQTALVCVAVDEDLDLATAPGLRAVLVGHIEGGATHITIDLSACEFLDSTGLSLLVTTHRRLLEIGGGLHLAGATGQVQDVLKMAGTTEFFGQAERG